MCSDSLISSSVSYLVYSNTSPIDMENVPIIGYENPINTISYTSQANLGQKREAHGKCIVNEIVVLIFGFGPVS